MIVINARGAASRTVAARSLADFNFALSSSVVDTPVTAGTTGSHTTDDQVFTDHTAATIDHGAHVALSVTAGHAGFLSPQLTNLSSGVATLDATGNLTRVADGSAGILASLNGLTKRIDVAISREGGASTSIFANFVSGSLARHCADAIDSRLAGQNSTTSLPIFSTLDHSAHSYVRAGGCWAANIDLTSVAVWNSSNGGQIGATLISPRHVLMAAHAALGNGTTLIFVNGSNANVTRTLVSSVFIAQDIQIGVLDSDVPAGINFAKTLPASAIAKLPGVVQGVPGLAVNQSKQALAVNLKSLAYGGNNVIRGAGTNDRVAFSRAIISGDSGHPIFAVIGGYAVLLGAFDGPSVCSALVQHIAAINTAMTALGGGYQLTAASIASFPTY